MARLSDRELKEMAVLLAEGLRVGDPLLVRPEVLVARLDERSRRRVEVLRARFGVGWPLSVRVMLSFRSWWVEGPGGRGG